MKTQFTSSGDRVYSGWPLEWSIREVYWAARADAEVHGYPEGRVWLDVKPDLRVPLVDVGRSLPGVTHARGERW